MPSHLGFSAQAGVGGRIHRVVDTVETVDTMDPPGPLAAICWSFPGAGRSPTWRTHHTWCVKGDYNGVLWRWTPPDPEYSGPLLGWRPALPGVQRLEDKAVKLTGYGP